MRKELKKKARSFAIEHKDKDPMWVRERIVDMICDYYEKDIVVEFEDRAKEMKNSHADLEEIGVWTDGLILYSSYEKVGGWPCAYRLKKDKKYKIIIKEVE